MQMQIIIHVYTSGQEITPTDQIIRSPSTGIHTHSSDDLNKQCHYAGFMSFTEPITIKDALLDHNWIVTLQEELAKFERNTVWNLVPKPKGVP